MSAVEGTSVPPPGWKEGQSDAAYVSPAAPPIAQATAAVAEPLAAVGLPAAPVMVTEPLAAVVVTAGAAPVVTAGQAPTEAAIRWRLGAAAIDNLLVYALYLLLCGILHWRALTVGHLLVLLVLGVVYHFAFESNGGQTIGKRFYGIRVVSVDGGPPTAKGIALRSVLRCIDALPFWYLSGLVNMVRTGPERRQRIGDVAGETKVIAVGGRAASRGTPSWYLPAATLLAFAISALGIYGIVEAGRQPLSNTQQAQFISGCARSAAGQMLNCQCFLSRLEADGYDTPNSLNALLQDARNEETIGQSGAARGELESDAFACHK